MAQIITIAQAFAQWKDGSGMGSPFEIHGKDDYPALSESWNDYTDGLCKDGQLNDLQYHHCPAWDDEMPGDTVGEDGAFLLESMGVQFDFASVIALPDGCMADSTYHWRYNIKRGGQVMSGYYSTGAAHTGEPENADVFNYLLLGSDGVDELFETWADNLGYDADSRQAENIYNACKQTLIDLERMFTSSELADLREVFENF